MKLITIILALPLLVGGIAGAQPPSPPAPPPSSNIGLSPDQMKRVDALRREFGARMRELGQALAEHRRSLETLYSQYNLDTNQAKQINKEINRIQRSMLDEHLKLQVKLRSILTEEQFNRLRLHMEHRGPGYHPDHPQR